MTTEDAFLQAIVENPDDLASLLIYADWLIDEGESARAEFIRVQCRLAKLGPRDPKRSELKVRQQELRLGSADWVQQFGVLMTWERALSLFRRRLAETITWCSGTSDLRTPALKPVALLQPRRAIGHWEWPSAWSGERHVIINALANRRAKLLAGAGMLLGLAGGRLLLFYPDDASSNDSWLDDVLAIDLEDLENRVASDGILDFENVPAWDTWVSYAENWNPPEKGWIPFSSYLVSWVPAELVEAVDRRINGDPEGCLRWAADTNSVLTGRLREAGLLA